MMDVIDLFDLGVAHQRNGIEARHGFAHRGKGRREAAERLHVGLRTHVLVMIEDDFTNDIADADHAVLEAPFGPGARGALLAFHGIGIDIAARETIFGGDQIGTDTLRREIGLVGDRRVHRPGAAIGPHWHAAHAFDAAADGEHRFAGHHLGRCHVDGFQPRGTETVDLYASGGLRIIGIEHGNAGDIAALFAHRRNTAEDHIIDIRRIDAGAVAHRLQHLGAKLDRGDLVQLAVLAALATRRADGIIDIGFDHGHSPRELRQNAATGSAIIVSAPASNLARNAATSAKLRAA